MSKNSVSIKPTKTYKKIIDVCFKILSRLTCSLYANPQNYTIQSYQMAYQSQGSLWQWLTCFSSYGNVHWKPTWRAEFILWSGLDRGHLPHDENFVITCLQFVRHVPFHQFGYYARHSDLVHVGIATAVCVTGRVRVLMQFNAIQMIRKEKMTGRANWFLNTHGNLSRARSGIPDTSLRT